MFWSLVTPCEPFVQMSTECVLWFDSLKPTSILIDIAILRWPGNICTQTKFINQKISHFCTRKQQNNTGRAKLSLLYNVSKRIGVIFWLLHDLLKTRHIHYTIFNRFFQIPVLPKELLKIQNGCPLKVQDGNFYYTKS